MMNCLTTYFGARGITKSAAQEFADYGIRVNSIHPGILSYIFPEPLKTAVIIKAVDRIPIIKIKQTLYIFIIITKLLLFLKTQSNL